MSNIGFYFLYIIWIAGFILRNSNLFIILDFSPPSSQNDCITGTAYIGMSDEINEQYFHGIMSRFTIQDIFRVHHVRAAIPAPIANIGFPDGLEVGRITHH